MDYLPHCRTPPAAFHGSTSAPFGLVRTDVLGTTPNVGGIGLSASNLDIFFYVVWPESKKEYIPCLFWGCPWVRLSLLLFMSIHLLCRTYWGHRCFVCLLWGCHMDFSDFLSIAARHSTQTKHSNFQKQFYEQKFEILMHMFFYYFWFQVRSLIILMVTNDSLTYSWVSQCHSLYYE